MKSKLFVSFLGFYILLMLVGIIISCTKDDNTTITGESCGITSSATGEVISNMQAAGTGGGEAFDGKVDTSSDLDDLVTTAWGNGSLGLHRGHAPIESVLEAFLGISHNEMHVMMEQCNMNLAAICESFELEPENLIETLTNSFVPFIEEGVTNGVINSDEVDSWTDQVRVQFSNRVYWEG